MKLRDDMLTHGVYIVTAEYEKERRGLAVAWACQVGIERVMILVGSQSTTREQILASGAFGFNILYAGQQELAKKFGTISSVHVDKFEGLEWHTGETGSPLLDDCGMCLDCRVEAVHNSKDEAQLIIGKVVKGELRKEGYSPLLYTSSDYF